MNTKDMSAKDKAIFVLETLLDLVRKDRVHASEIEGKTADEIIAMAETKAAEAVENSQNLADGN